MVYTYIPYYDIYYIMSYMLHTIPAVKNFYLITFYKLFPGQIETNFFLINKTGKKTKIIILIFFFSSC